MEMTMPKPNSGGSYPNQGDRKKPGNPNTGSAAKTDFKVHKGKSKKSSGPPYLP